MAALAFFRWGMAPVTTEERAALRGFFALTFGGLRHHKANVQDKLVTYHADKGEALANLALDVDTQDVDQWREEWEIRCESAGIDDRADRVAFVRWLRKRSSPASTNDPSKGVVQTVVETLEAEGAVITSSQLIACNRAAATLAAGDAVTQCTSAACVWLLYTGMMPDREDVTWYDSQVRMASGGGFCSAPVNIMGRDSYRSALRTGELVLLRALSTWDLFSRWRLATCDTLMARGLEKASVRLSAVVSQSELTFSQVLPRLRYLRDYFFYEFKGLGMPSEVAERSARNEMGRLQPSLLDDAGTHKAYRMGHGDHDR